MKRHHVLLLLVCTLGLATCKSKVSSTLSPARNILGTWVSGPVNVYEQVNYSNCTTSTFVPVYTWNTFKTSFTFVISQYPPDTTTYVNITISPVSGNAGFCGTTTPMDDGNLQIADGVVSSSQLTLTDSMVSLMSSGVIERNNFVVGNFSFTTNLMTGKFSWLEYTSQADPACIGYTTDQISLTKQ